MVESFKHYSTADSVLGDIMTSHISTSLGMKTRRMDIHEFPVSGKKKNYEAESDDGQGEWFESDYNEFCEKVLAEIGAKIGGKPAVEIKIKLVEESDRSESDHDDTELAEMEPGYEHFDFWGCRN